MRRVVERYGLYMEDLKPVEATILADVSDTCIQIVSVMIPWTYPNGVGQLEALEMLTVETLCEIKEYLRSLNAVDNPTWPEGVV